MSLYSFSVVALTLVLIQLVAMTALFIILKHKYKAAHVHIDRVLLWFTSNNMKREAIPVPAIPESDTEDRYMEIVGDKNGKKYEGLVQRPVTTTPYQSLRGQPVYAEVGPIDEDVQSIDIRENNFNDVKVD